MMDARLRKPMLPVLEHGNWPALKTSAIFRFSKLRLRNYSRESQNACDAIYAKPGSLFGRYSKFTPPRTARDTDVGSEFVHHANHCPGAGFFRSSFYDYCVAI
jgi:hypothetical protein